MLVDVRLMAASRMRGVCGRDGAFSPSSFSSSARISCSAASDLPLAADGLDLTDLLVAERSVMPSKSSSSSSVSEGVAFVRLLAIVAAGLWRGGGVMQWVMGGGDNV